MNERIAALEAQVAALRDVISHMRRTQPMRRTHRCPACGHGRLLHFRYVAEAWPPDRSVPFTLQKPRDLKGPRPKNFAAPIEAYVCKRCQLVELGASILGVELDGTQVVEVSSDEPPAIHDGPYR